MGASWPDGFIGKRHSSSTIEGICGIQTYPYADNMDSLAIGPYCPLLLVGPLDNICTELMNVSHCWSANNDMSIYGYPQGDLTNELVSTSPAYLI